MRTIWKFAINEPCFALTLSHSWLPVLAGRQGLGTYLWIEHDPDAPGREFRFQIVGTGHPVPTGAVWQKSWQDGQFVWHLYWLEDLT
jgi:hypothetical protein